MLRANVHRVVYSRFFYYYYLFFILITFVLFFVLFFFISAFYFKPERQSGKALPQCRLTYDNNFEIIYNNNKSIVFFYRWRTCREVWQEQYQ